MIEAWFIFSGKKAAAGGPPTQMVATSGGQLRGFGQDGLSVYLGIPYAEAPAGKLRFKAPVARQPWQGTLDAYGFGAFCPQVYDKVVIDDPQEDLNNEDCLSLNIWSRISGYGGVYARV